jgi:hypothetical protein
MTAYLGDERALFNSPITFRGMKHDMSEKKAPLPSAYRVRKVHKVCCILPHPARLTFRNYRFSWSCPYYDGHLAVPFKHFLYSRGERIFSPLCGWTSL